MAGDSTAATPSVIWAQRSEAILLTICLEDCVEPKIDLKPKSLSFSGTGGVEKKFYSLTINFYEEIDPEKSGYAVRDRVIEFVLSKKNGNSPYWPRLTSEKVKYHWLKVDFSKWRDEDSDEEGEEQGDMDLASMMKNMGNFSGDSKEKVGMDDLNWEGGEDSDDEDLPDLE